MFGRKKNKIKRKYRGLFNKKYDIDRKIIKLVNENELDVVITDVDTGHYRPNESRLNSLTFLHRNPLNR